MRKHEETATEQLSAYIDGELPDAEASELEARLASDSTTRRRLEGLRQVVEGLRQSEPPPPPPPTLHHAVARRIALERDRVPFLDRFEASLSPLARHNPLLPMFAVILVLAIAVYFLSVMFERAENPETEVIVVGSTEGGTAIIGSRIEIENRVLFWNGELWRERGTPETATRIVAIGTPEGDALLAADPTLADLVPLESPAVIWFEGEAIQLEPASGP